MQEKIKAGELLNTLNFTNQQVADFCEVSESMIRKVRTWTKNPSPKLATKIKKFVQQKIRHLERLLPRDGE